MDNLIVEIKDVNRMNLSDYGDCIVATVHPTVPSPFGFGSLVNYSKRYYLIYSNTDKNMEYLLKEKNNPNEFFEIYDSVFSEDYIEELGDCFIHDSIYYEDSFGISLGEPVDLGLSVLWADRNVGAEDIDEYGSLISWNEAHSESDELINLWLENGWRLPTDKELKELSDRCRLMKDDDFFIDGVNCLGPSGRSIFIPFSGVKMGIDTFRRGQLAMIWADNESSPKYGIELMVIGRQSSVNYSTSKEDGKTVRMVKDIMF